MSGGFKKGELARLRRENAKLREIAYGFQIYSRRYCDGRSTYAPGEHNQLTHDMISLGIKPPHDPISETGPFAADGMCGLTLDDRMTIKMLENGTLFSKRGEE